MHRKRPLLGKFRSLLLASLVLVAGAVRAQPWQPFSSPWKIEDGTNEGRQELAYDDAPWKSVDLSATTAAGVGDDGAAWIRLHLRVPGELRGQDLLLLVGAANDNRVVYFNGAKIAGGFGTGNLAVYLAPEKLVHFGEDNVIAIQIAGPAGWAGLRGGDFGWSALSSASGAMLASAIDTSKSLEGTFAAGGQGAVDFMLRGMRPADLEALRVQLTAASSPEVCWRIATCWSRLREIAQDPEKRIREYALLQDGDALGFMRNQVAYLVPDFHGDALQRPALGSELSDFGSWYDIAYSGGMGRFMIGSVRKGVGPDHEFFNTARDVGLLALFVRTGANEIIDGSGGESTVAWYPYGWKTTTRQGGLEIESAVFFTSFDTVVVFGSVKNTGTVARAAAPCLLVATRSEYDGRTGGHVTGALTGNGFAQIRNERVGLSTTPELYSDTLTVGSTLGALKAQFSARYLPTGRGVELGDAAGAAQGPGSLDSAAGSAILNAGEIRLAPGETREFAFVVAAAPVGGDSQAQCEDALRAFAKAPGSALAQAQTDWNEFLGKLPRLENPTYAATKLYYSAAVALRKNRYLLQQENGLHSASFPARGGFNYFYQSDSCWNLLGYLDFNPSWAEGHAVPIMVPPCEIMDPHFFWSMWELYSRIPEGKERLDFAARVYPLLKDAYRVWTTKLDIDGDLLVATPDNWDDNPRYDLIFKEVKYAPGWNSWWNDLVLSCRNNALDDPAPSSQLGYGAVVMGRLARILGKDQEAEEWSRQLQRHIRAVGSLWDEDHGYWIVTYRGSERDTVLTSSIVYPIFTDLCRDPVKIRRVIEGHLLNPGEFNGRYPVPTVAYDDPRYYHQKPPFENLAGGLWRGNLWMPEAWIIVKGMYKYGYEAEARDFARRLVDMMAHQSASVGPLHQFDYSPSEWYDSRTGLSQNNRAFSWSSAVALDFLLGNYENERVVGSNEERDKAIDGHIREIFDFATGRSLFRVETAGPVFPVLKMSAEDGLPIDRSQRVGFVFSDAAGNFADTQVAFSIDANKWRVVEASGGRAFSPDEAGIFHIPIGTQLVLNPASHAE